MESMDNSFLFIRDIKLREDIEPQKFDSFPLNINALRFFVSLRFTTPVTIFNGENGCGKSTLIEAIAANLDIPIMGGNKNLSGILDNYNRGEEANSELAQFIVCGKGYSKPYRTFFFRAESFYKLADILMHDGWINSDNYSSKDLLEQSHGESFMDFMNHQFAKNSLYILDEPEAALSPENQLRLIALIDKFAKQGCQFIIVTHSPFILGYREARIINLDDGMKEISFKQTKIYNLYRRFLEDPEQYQKILLDEED